MNLRVLVYHCVRAEFDYTAAACSGQPEAGGILLGAYRGPDMEVTGLTQPGPAEERRRRSFTRADPLHKAANVRAWEDSGGTVSYVGEWHTHPSGAVTPSSVDVHSWRGEARRCGRPMVFVLVVPGEWGIFTVRPKWMFSSKARLVPRESGKTGVVFG
jgi:integrative and conjugative element protein (TIGR02256 family)